MEIPAKARRQYHGQHGGAKQRGIVWGFTLETWWQVWLSSGKWEQRGRAAHQYQMARNGDVGPYSPENVRIVTRLQNVREKEANGVGNLGRGKGWKLARGCKTKPYEARIAGKYIGMFATEREAEAAYKAAAVLLMKKAQRELAHVH